MMGTEKLRIIVFNYSMTEFVLVNTTNLMYKFLNVLIAFLYMFRAAMCPTSGENTVPMRHLVSVTLYR